MDNYDEPGSVTALDDGQSPVADPNDHPRAESSPEPVAGDDATSAPSTNGEPRQSDNPNLNLTKIRELILTAHEDVVPELVTGETFEELLASIEPARQAFQQVVERIIRPASTVSPIPAGQPGRSATHDPRAANLNPSAKIAEGLRRRTG